jgi:hypothetical protein
MPRSIYLYGDCHYLVFPQFNDEDANGYSVALPIILPVVGYQVVRDAWISPRLDQRNRQPTKPETISEYFEEKKEYLE